MRSRGLATAIVRASFRKTLNGCRHTRPWSRQPSVSGLSRIEDPPEPDE